MTMHPWNDVGLGDAVEFLDSQRRPVKVGDRAKMRGPIPYYGASGIVDYVDKYLFDEELILLGEDGENILSRAVPLAFKISGRAWVNNHAHVLRTRPAFDINFLAAYLESLNYSGLNTGTAQPKLNKQSCLTIRVPRPPIAEQKQIAEVLSDADEMIAKLKQLIAKKQAIKQGMMQQLMTGRTRLPGFNEAWSETTLGAVARFSKGAGLPKSALTATGSTPCIHYGELFTFYGPVIRQVSSRTTPIGSAVVSEDLDVLMPTSDVTPRGLAKASAVHGAGVVLGGDILIIRPDRSRAFGPFLAHAIRRDADQVLQFVRGSTVYHLYATDMRNFALSLPSVREQRAIADALLDADRELATVEARLTKARAIKTGIMQQLLSGRTRLPVSEGVPS